MFRHNYVDTFGARFFFRRPRPSNFRVTINCPRHSVVHHGINGFTEHVFNSNNRLGVSNVRKLRSIDQVAYRINTLFACCAITINFNEATLAQLDGCAFQAEQICKWLSANRHHNCIDIQSFAFAKQHGCSACAIEFMAGNFYASTNVDVLLLETLDNKVCNVWV